MMVGMMVAVPVRKKRKKIQYLSEFGFQMGNLRCYLLRIIILGNLAREVR